MPPLLAKWILVTATAHGIVGLWAGPTERACWEREHEINIPGRWHGPLYCISVEKFKTYEDAAWL